MADIPVVAPLPKVADTSSARDFFQQDDKELGQAWGVVAPEPEAEAEGPDAGAAIASLSAPVTEEEGEPARPAPSAEKAPVVTEVELPKAERRLMTEFKVMDQEGELEVPEIKIKFKAKGEERELPLDHVVRLAQFGFANEEREQQVLAAKQFVSEAQQKEEQYKGLVNQYEGYYEKLFGDPAFYEEARLAYLNQNTPEARAQRTEQELHQVRAAQAQEKESQVIAGFVAQTITPEVSRLMQENPLVSENEVIGQYTRLTAPLLVRGRVPFQRLQQVEHLVKGDLANWVQQTQYERTLATRKIDQQKAQATQQVAAQKRQTGRIFSAPGSVAEPSQKPTKFDSARSWLDSAFPLPGE